VLGSKTGWAEYELRRMTEDDSLNQAFRLAHSIYCFRPSDRTTALEIVAEALRALEVRLLAQHEADRHDPQKPTKVRWNTLQWFQLLIYFKSEPYEKQQETKHAASLSGEDMIIRYIKHLILTTSRRNSFHISLGMSRLLYDYSAAETMAIYDLVFQDPDSSTKKADAYYRARKNKLLEELEKRFHRFVKIHLGPRGEKRFESHEEPARSADLVVDYLTRFTPWETNCELPKQLDTWTAVRALKSSQASQIHALIHPVCFSKIIAALKFDSPATRLRLPRFFLGKSESDTTPPPADSSPSDLTQDETTTIREELAEQKNRGKKFTPHSLAVLADGIERGRFDLGESSLIRFSLERDVSLLELVGRNEEGELLLATHVFSDNDDESIAGQSQTFSIVLGGGQNISLVLLPVHAGIEDESTTVEIKYEETKAIRAVALWWRQVKHRHNRGKVAVLIPKAAFAVLALLAAGFILYLVLKSPSRGPEQIAKQAAPPSTNEAGKIPTPATTSSPQMTTTPQELRTPRKPEQLPGVTREPSGRAVKSLLEVERVYVGSMGDDAFSRSVQQQVIEKLRASNQYVVTQGPEDADTAVTGLARMEGKRRAERTSQEIEVGHVALQFVNVSGDVIWRTKRLQGTAEEIAAQFMSDLLATIEKEKRRQKNLK
jgi:hypothetical protein